MKSRKPKGRKNHSVEEEEEEEEEEKDEEEEDDEMDVEEENLDGLMFDHIRDTPKASSPEQHTAVSSSVLQLAAAYCSEQQRTAVSSSVLQSAAAYCSEQQHNAENVEVLKLDHIGDATTKQDICIIPEGLTPCKLALSNPRYRVVATGNVHNFKTGTVMHLLPIPSGYARVCISYSTEMDTPLPVPLEGEAVTIGEAIGTLVFWPIELIVLDTAGLTPCKLALSNPRYRVVATGNVHNFKTGTVMHLLPIPSGYARVCISYSTEMDTPLPVPLEGEAVTIGEAIGTLVFWPIELIVLDTAAEISSKDNDKQVESIKTPTSSTGESHKVDDGCEGNIDVATLPECLFMFHICVSKMERNEQIKMPIHIGVTTQSKNIFLGRKEIFRLLAQKELELPHILTYMSFHWVLCVIDPYNNTVYYLDSLRTLEFIGNEKGIIGDLLEIVNTALLQFRSDRELATKLKMNTKWIKIQCPCQEDYIDCGYYVMRFMKEIISHKRLQISEE
ncbi:hypothetical protein SOVF_150320 isoform B, partial [Spinacia oleracea]